MQSPPVCGLSWFLTFSSGPARPDDSAKPGGLALQLLGFLGVKAEVAKRYPRPRCQYLGRMLKSRKTNREMVEVKMGSGCHPLGSSTFHPVFLLLEWVEVSVGAGFERFLAAWGSSPISHPK